MKTKLREMDLFRAIAALAVIAIHVTSGQYASNSFAFVWNLVMCFAVPVFIMISGNLLHHSDMSRESFSFMDFYKKRLSKVIIPYFLWTIIYMVFTFKRDHIKILSMEFLDRLPENLLLGKAFAHLYFMAIIIQLYFVYPLLREAIIKNEKLTLLVSFFISMYFQVEPFFRIRGFLILPAFGQKYYFLFFARWCFYVALGMYLARKRDKLLLPLSKMKVELFILWALLGTVIIMVNKSFTYETPIKYPLIIAYTISSYFFIYSVCISIKEMKSKLLDFLEWFSKQSFIIYLSHLLLMNVLLMNLSKLVGFNIWGRTYGLILYFIATIAVTSIFAYLISFTPIAQWLGGVREKKSRI